MRLPPGIGWPGYRPTFAPRPLGCSGRASAWRRNGLAASSWSATSPGWASCSRGGRRRSCSWEGWGGVNVTEPDMLSGASLEPPRREPLSPEGATPGGAPAVATGALALLRTMTGDAGAQFRPGQLEAIQAIV